MTFLPIITGTVSDGNSSATLLSAGDVFSGVVILAREYSTVCVTVCSDVSGNVSIEFSPDGANWDIIRTYNYAPSTLNYSKQVLIEGEFVRVVYTNGPATQSAFRLQTRLHVNNTARDSEQLIDCAARMKDAFGRLRTSTPFTLLDITHSQTINNIQESELVVGAGSSSYQSDAGVTLSVAGAGDRVMRQSRARAVCPPGKSVLVLITGILNLGNAATTTSRMGYYADANGFYVEYSDNRAWVGYRSGVSGSTVDTKVEQSLWNGSSNIVLDLGKVHVFFFDFQWLGVGIVKVGVIVNGIPQLLHVFHSTTIQYASLPTRYEVESGGGSASMKNFASTVISEGGYIKPGLQMSANTGITPRSVRKNVAAPIFSIRLVPGSRANVKMTTLNILRQGRYAGLWEIYVFRDVAGVVLSPNFQPKSQHVECDFEATALVASGTLVTSGYESGDSTSSFNIQEDINAVIANNISDVSDMLVVMYTAIDGSDDVFVSASWKEFL